MKVNFRHFLKNFNRKIVMLYCDDESENRLREFCRVNNIDCSSVDHFHCTVICSTNKVYLENDDFILPETVECNVTGVDLLGPEQNIAVSLLDCPKFLKQIRDYYQIDCRMNPTFIEFKPHISYSYNQRIALGVIDKFQGPVRFNRLVVTDFIN